MIPLTGATDQLPIHLGAALKEIADHVPGVGYTKQHIARAATLAGLSYWRAFDIWYGKARRIGGYEAYAIGQALQVQRREVTRNELRELRSRLARLEVLLAQQDQDRDREVVDRLRAAVDGPRRAPRAVVKP